MKYRSIFIANIAEIAKPLTLGMSDIQREHEVYEDHAYCDRFLASERDYRILVTPLKLDPDFVDDMSKMLRYKNSLFLSPNEIKESICEAIMRDTALLKKLIAIIRDNPQITIHSYAVTEEFSTLVSLLRKKGLHFKTHEMPDSSSSWSGPFFDSKAGFRQATTLFGETFPEMPRGIIVSGKEELIGWMRYYLLKMDGVVLKSNRGLAGAGLRIIKKDDIQVKDIQSYVELLLKDEPFWLLEPIVVEEYIDPDITVCGGAPNIELCIEDNAVEVLYACGMRINNKGVFLGIEFGKGAVSSRLSKDLNRSGRRFGSVLAKVGYSGHFEIDFVFGKKSRRLYPIEANVRRTGGTHAFELAERLLGEDKWKENYIISVNKIDAPKYHNRSYKKLRDDVVDCLYPMGKNPGEGVIITMANYLEKGRIGYVVIAKTKERAYAIEEQFVLRLS